MLSEKEEAFGRVCSTTVRLKDICVQQSGGNSSENKMMNYLEYEDRINEYIDDLYAIKLEILDVIKTVEKSKYRTLLILRYIGFKEWAEIAEIMNYSERQITNIHGQALSKVTIPGTLP